MTPRHFEPRAHQALMVDHILTHARCAVWADMGMGKTSAALSALHALDLVEPGPTLVVAPLRVANDVWPHEAGKWIEMAGLRVVPVTGTPAERLRALHRRPRADVYAINYEQLPWLIEHCRAQQRWPFPKVIADESTRLKSFRLRGGGKRARALGAVAHTHVKHWINLTGTPVPNGLVDLWGQTWFLDEGHRLGRTFTCFTQRYFTEYYDGSLEPRPGAAEQIGAALSDICLTVRAEDWFPVERPIVNVVEVHLPERARRLYRDMERQMIAEIGGEEITAVSAAARTLKCLQLANGAIYTDDGAADGAAAQWIEVHDEKLRALESVIEEAREPVIVAYHFRSDLVRIKRAFPSARELDHDPGTIRDWNAGRIPILLLHPSSAGHGLNLQDGGRRIVFFGHWWALEEYQQAVERIGPVRQRQAGHPRPVFVTHIVAADTVDELVVARRETKISVQDAIRDLARRRA